MTIEREPDSIYSRYKLDFHYSPTKTIQVERLYEPDYAGDTPVIEMFVREANNLTPLMLTLDEAEELALVLQAVINTYKRDGE